LPTVIVEFESFPTPVRFPLRSLPRTAEQRQHTLLLLGRQVADQYHRWKIVRLWLINEAWMSMVQPGPGYQPPVPAQDPDRREVLVVLELDATTLQQTAEIRQIRRRNKKVTCVRMPDLSMEGLTFGNTQLLAFLAGFAERAGTSMTYGPIYTRIEEEQKKIDRFFLTQCFDEAMDRF
ncbi:MAG TPA: hypothetical protein VKX46_12080, partial [Ktedonobacteraceae bacterium]|nr:hypothetical protein [Ktedonobacteraceae bacterium]